MGHGCPWATSYYYPKLGNDNIKENEVDNLLEKIDFADIVKDAKSVAGFSPWRQYRVGRNGVT